MLFKTAPDEQSLGGLGHSGPQALVRDSRLLGAIATNGEDTHHQHQETQPTQHHKTSQE
jgi:hypothetical protein